MNPEREKTLRSASKIPLSLDFERVDPHLAQRAQMRKQRQVLETQIMSRPARCRKRQTARLGAKPAVAAASAEDGAQKALAGYAHAQRAVHEHLDLYVGILSDFRQFLAPQLARHDRTRKAHIPQRGYARRRLHRRLCRRVQRDVAALPRQTRNAQILYDQRVDARLGSSPERAAHVVRFRIGHERIDRQVQLCAV